MTIKEFQIRCPHCGDRFDLDGDRLSARHMLAALTVSLGRPDAGELLESYEENYALACPGCEKLFPFEPRSRFRQRKVVALQHRLDALAKLPVRNDSDRKAAGLAAYVGELFLGTLQTDFPLEQVRQQVDKLRPVIEEDAGVELKGHRALSLLHEMLDITTADIGERDDLPEAPIDDEVEEKRVALLNALDDLHAEQRDKSLIQQADKQKSGGCFIATACCGSPADPLVRDLRRFRDEVLVARAPGRALAAAYARFSPPVADWISGRAWARTLVRHTVVRPLAWAVRARGAIKEGNCTCQVSLSKIVCHPPISRQVKKHRRFP